MFISFKTKQMHSKSFGVNTTVLPNHFIVSLSCYLCAASKLSGTCALSGRKTALQNFWKSVSCCPTNLISASLITKLLPETANRIAFFLLMIKNRNTFSVLKHLECTDHQLSSLSTDSHISLFYTVQF